MARHQEMDQAQHLEFRATMGKLFDKAEADRALAAEHHVEVVKLIHESVDKLREDLRSDMERKR